ncbi:MAG: hypothetical protein M0Q91_05505 [Methanoregula sp.]|nr:hypothetical protein [Methanoregula sp.]
MEKIKNMRPEAKQVTKIFALWTLIAILLRVFMPDDLKWLAWIPVMFIFIAVVVSVIALFLKQRGFFQPVIARIKGREYKSCLFCPENRIKENPVNRNLLIHKCSASGMRILFYPMKVPRWCPYAVIS